MISRTVDPMASVVLSVTALAAGTAANVVPGQAVARGTVRARTTADRTDVHKRLVEVADPAASAHGCCVEVEFVPGESVLDNDAELATATALLLDTLGLQVERLLELRVPGKPQLADQPEHGRRADPGPGGEPGHGLQARPPTKSAKPQPHRTIPTAPGSANRPHWTGAPLTGCGWTFKVAGFWTSDVLLGGSGCRCRRSFPSGCSPRSSTVPIRPGWRCPPRASWPSSSRSAG
ncbi:peptidase dimerization domain-containing protein [Saccharopolyspora spinosa]|uniref:peptidase dimerization domain-containing protein n=1 Tax=Saccharopolyspora spinosa TaxID=60894 RepID=UPI003748C06E